MAHTWSEQREKLLNISNTLDSQPFPVCFFNRRATNILKFDSTQPRQQTSPSDTYFDDCCWISLLLREVIVQKANSLEPEPNSAENDIPDIVTLLLRLEEQLTSGSAVSDSRVYAGNYTC